jgi:hypothetical protein
MAKELPILPSTAQPAEGAAPEAVIYSRVFCKNDNAPPLRLLMEFLKSRGQLPILPPRHERCHAGRVGMGAGHFGLCARA